jgi:hypothetical protein
MKWGIVVKPVPNFKVVVKPTIPILHSSRRILLLVLSSSNLSQVQLHENLNGAKILSLSLSEAD